MAPRLTPERFCEQIYVEPSGCWIWRGELVEGHAALRDGGRPLQLHRLVYEAWRGPIPEDLEFYNQCSPACLQPWHWHLRAPVASASLPTGVLLAPAPAAARRALARALGALVARAVLRRES